MKEIMKALRPVKKRIRRNRLIRGAAAGLAAGLCAAALLQIPAFFMPVPDRGLWALAAAAAGVLLAAAWSVLRPVSDRTAADAADGCGLEERTVTALEGGEGEIRRLQRADALSALAALDVKKIRPGSVKKFLAAALGCGLLLGTMLLVPNAQDGKAAEQKAFRRILREGTEAVEQAAEEDGKDLAEDERTELRRITGDLKRDLEQSRDEADALVALDRAGKRLEQFRQKTAGDVSAAMKGTSGETPENTSEGGGEKKGNGEEQEAAGKGSGAQGTGEQGAGEQTGSSANGAQKTQSAVAALKAQMTPSAQQTGQAGNASGTPQERREGGNSGGSGGNGGMPGGTQAGSGAGEGSTNQEQKGGGQSGGTHSQGTRDPKLRETAYETIYDPERTAVSLRDETTHQNRLGEEGSQQLETGPGKGALGGDVPWGEALKDYEETEARAADRGNLTTRERQWVTDYFRILAEQSPE